MIESAIDISSQPKTELLNANNPFIIKVDKKHIPAFAKFVNEHSVSSILTTAAPIARMDQHRGKTYSADDWEIVEQFSNFYDGYKNARENFRDVPISCRWVSADKNFPLTRLVDEGYEFGGSEPGQKHNWIHAEASGAMVKVMNPAVRADKSGVIFVYDDRKLVGITEEDKERFGKYHNAYYYAVKPIEGLKFKDTLLGMIVLDNS